MTEWEKMNIIKKCQRAVEGINLKSPFETRCAVVDVQEALEGFTEENCTDVVEVVDNKEYHIRFADGVEYQIIEGVAPFPNGGSYDILFVMDTTTTDWKVVDWVHGISLMTPDDIVEFCKELRKKEKE